ncbi:hypothetical protein GGR52DRAFT_591531 [Hypoxylon sp. FL1284]|nr:hypothetical protein GGR52DRAFT_591531 [Hypoxylon sp. FL1284]
MASGPELIKKSFEKDVLKRAVNNTSDDPCSCGLYKYYSQKCGCIYKSVYLKCGKTISEKTGRPILCGLGRGRNVKVQDALVPFYCKNCRERGVRWNDKVGKGNEHQQGEAQDDGEKGEEIK